MANGKSDVQLTDDFDGQVKVAAPDLLVDGGPGRRRGSNTPYRRALVHDTNDGLTINWENDYAGGVTMNGVTKMTGHTFHVGNVPMQGITIEGGALINLNAVGLTFKGGVINLNCEPDQAAGVKISGNVHFDKDVTIDGRVLFHRKPLPGAVVVTPPGQPPLRPSLPDDLAQVILELQQKVAALEQKTQHL